MCFFWFIVWVFFFKLLSLNKIAGIIGCGPLGEKWLYVLFLIFPYFLYYFSFYIFLFFCLGEVSESFSFFIQRGRGWGGV